MPAIAWLRNYSVEAGWALFACANVAAMIAFPSWETIPFYFVWTERAARPLTVTPAADG
jgi:hypothetical protein